MVNSRFRQYLCWFLVLSVGHCPIPCFDADWEDRGVQFDSVFDTHAWHTMLLGVAAPDDIDRGPFREQSDDAPTSPYGESFVVTAGVTASSLDGVDSGSRVVTSSAVLLMRTLDVSQSISVSSLPGPNRSSRHRCALLCVMLV